MANRSRRVLVVDDDPDARELFSQVLEQAGAEVTRADDGLTALRVASERQPDLVITDIEMPRMNGVELTRQLRNRSATKAIPIVVVTGAAIDDLTGHARAVGCSTVVPKPCAPDLLVGIVNRHIGRRREDGHPGQAHPFLPIFPERRGS
jgi:two-component system chemotaxis response regulator CheY